MYRASVASGPRRKVKFCTVLACHHNTVDVLYGTFQKDEGEDKNPWALVRRTREKRTGGQQAKRRRAGKAPEAASAARQANPCTSDAHREIPAVVVYGRSGVEVVARAIFSPAHFGHALLPSFLLRHRWIDRFVTV